MRQNFNELQEITSDDLNRVSSRNQRFLMDTIIQNILGNPPDGFFQNSFLVTRVSAVEVTIRAGLGIHLLSSEAYEPTRRPILLEANSTQIISTPDASNDRYDIVSVKSDLIDDVSESRKFKDFASGSVVTESAVISKKWGADIVITEGTPAASPAIPSTPAGYVKIATILVEAANGIVAEANISDNRVLMPLAGSVGSTGNREYDAVIGDTSLLGFTHETLKAALDDASIVSGSKILVTRNEDIGTTPEITKDDIEIVFKPNVTFTDDGAGTGLTVNANGCKITGGRFSGFTAGIAISATKNYNLIANNRFESCTDALTGLGTKNQAYGNIEE